jgi:drug/metabolite transporter (DMT)-like permease
MNTPDLDQPPVVLPYAAPLRMRTPLRVWIGLTIAVALDAPVQLMWKALMLKYRNPAFTPHGDNWHHVRWFIHQTRTYALLSCFVFQFCDWIWVLGNTDLSFAQPFTALSYVIVSTGAVIFFHEHLSPFRIVGIGLILIGVVLVGSSEHRTQLPKEAA